MDEDKEYIINFTEKEIVEYWDCGYPLNIRAIVKQDREVVRCKDCKYWDRLSTGNVRECGLIEGASEWKGDDYCSYGERKEE